MRVFAAVVWSVCVLILPCASQEPALATPLAIGTLDPGSMRAFSDGCRRWDADRLWRAWENDPGRNAANDELVREAMAGSAGFWTNSEWARQSFPGSSARLKVLTEAIEGSPKSGVLPILRGEALAQAEDLDANYPELLGILHATSEHTALPMRRMYIGAVVHDHAANAGDTRVAGEALAYVRRALEQVILDPPEDPMHQRYLAFQLAYIASWSEPGFDLAETAQHAAEEAEDPWLALMVCGLSHKQIGWKARGRGLSHTVSPQGYFSFKQRMSIARVAFEDAYRLRPASPETATAMIDVVKSTTGDIDEMSLWFERATEAQASWMPAINEFIWAIRPRWHGSVAQLMILARWIAAQAVENDELADYFFKAIELIGEDAGSHRDIWLVDGLAGDARIFLERQIEKDRFPEMARQRLLGIAWARKEWGEAQRQLELLGEQTSWAALHDFRVHHQQAIDDVILGSTLTPSAIATGLEMASGGQHDVAARAFERAIASVDVNDSLRAAIRRSIAACRWRAGFEAGEVVGLHADEGLPGWRLWMGRARAREGRVLIGADEGNAWLSCDLDPGERYELRLECLAPQGAGRAWSRVILGHSKRTPTQQWHTVELRWHDAKARMRHRFDSRQSRPISGPLSDGRVDLRIVCFDGELLVEADGELLYRGPLAMGYDYTPGTNIYLSAWIGGQGRDAAFGDILIQRLTERPAELDGPASEVFDGKD